jgi:hypothetical protein
MVKMMRMVVRTDVHAREFVAVKKTWMKGINYLRAGQDTSVVSSCTNLISRTPVFHGPWQQHLQRRPHYQPRQLAT